jgi:hypothetical protein
MATNTTTDASPPPPITSPPPHGVTLGCESAANCVYFDVSDREILTSLLVFGIMGGVLLVLFGIVRNKMPIYFGRRRLRNLVGRDSKKQKPALSSPLPPVPPDYSWFS